MNNNDVAALRGLFKSASYKTAIKHIRFPRYKNLSPGLRVDFMYPITALVGGNGTNKTSILRALEACPEGQDLGNWWFSTSMDPIASGEQPRFIYGFHNESVGQVVEVRKVRIARKDRHLDYWESSKPADGMSRMPSAGQGHARRAGTRWNPIEKPVLYLDFRGELPAYDKFMRNPSAKESLKTIHARKDWIRQRSRHVKNAFDGVRQTFYNKDRVVEIVELSDVEINAVSRILGRKYSTIQMVLHEYFDRLGWTVRMETGEFVYSEAYAGSGEFAIVSLVHQLNNANKESLVLLDEPETSLHPASQKLLMDFIRDQVKAKHIQVVMATHSPYLIEGLPPEAIKLLMQDASGSVVLDEQETSQTEAFFRLGAPKSGKLQLIVEDRLAGEILHRGLKPLGEATLKRLEILSFPGGSSTIISRLIPNLAMANSIQTLILLDGDQRPDFDDRSMSSYDNDDSPQTLITATSSVSDDELEDAIAALFPGTPNFQLPLNSGSDSRAAKQKRETLRRLHSWIHDFVYFMPGLSPEEYICEVIGEPQIDSKAAKQYFRKRALEELCKERWEQSSLTSEQIFATQQRALMNLPKNDHNWEYIREVVSGRLNVLG